MPAKYLRPVDLDDETTAENVVAETTAGETESTESIETIFGPVVRRPVTPEQRVQPPNEIRTQPFQVGELHGTVLPERWALPPFQYPAPGEPLTAEIATEEFRYSDLRMKANRALNDLVMYYKLRVWLGDEETSNSVGNEERERLRRENKSFLAGVLQSHGFEVPSDELIERWAEEDLDHVANKQSDRG
jgi:hypothetical protein